MKNGNEFARIGQIFDEKQTISICLPQNVNMDAAAAATALYFALLHMNKQVSIACSTTVDSNFDLEGLDKVQTQLSSSGNTLVISFPYSDGAIDKVTYNIEGEKFNLLIQPKENASRLDSEKVQFAYSGGKAEVIITLFAPTLNALGSLYNSQKDKFSGVEIINIDRHFTNNNYGSINIVDKRASSMSEIVLEMLQSLNIAIDKEIATNLLSGIVSATNNFTSHSVSADTFTACAFLLNNGALKKTGGMMQRGVMNTQTPVQRQQFAGNQNQTLKPQEPSQRQQTQQNRQPVQQQHQRHNDDNQHSQPPVAKPFVPSNVPQSQEELEDINQQPGTAERKEAFQARNILKPNIFKGSNMF